MIDPEIRRKLNDLRMGFITCAGTFTLGASPATSTVVSRTGIGTNSVIIPMASSTASIQDEITAIVPAKDSFTVYHNNRTATRTYSYVFLTDAS